MAAVLLVAVRLLVVVFLPSPPACCACLDLLVLDRLVGLFFFFFCSLVPALDVAFVLAGAVLAAVLPPDFFLAADLSTTVIFRCCTTFSFCRPLSSSPVDDGGTKSSKSSPSGKPLLPLSLAVFLSPLPPMRPSSSLSVSSSRSRANLFFFCLLLLVVPPDFETTNADDDSDDADDEASPLLRSDVLLIPAEEAEAAAAANVMVAPGPARRFVLVPSEKRGMADSGSELGGGRGTENRVVN